MGKNQGGQVQGKKWCDSRKNMGDFILKLSSKGTGAKAIWNRKHAGQGQTGGYRRKAVTP